jgi:outer membrane protein OmpA-like peptidoglycan-associated protein
MVRFLKMESCMIQDGHVTREGDPTMHQPRSLPLWSSLAIIGIALFLATGCIREPQAIVDLRSTRSALDQAKQEGKADQFPDQFAELEKRYLQARGVFYACDDARASAMAHDIIADLNALRPAPANTPPVAAFTAPERVQAGELVRFDASASSDPDGDALTYIWDFGDGTGNRFTWPNAAHRFQDAGRYTVTLTVDDGRGGTDSTSSSIAVIRRVVLSEAEMVFFDFDKSTLKPAAQRIVDTVVAELMRNPDLRVEIVGHTDSIGTEQYNMGLSRRRAEAVASYITTAGVARDRLSVDWKGESQPLVPNTSPQNRAQNRRVVITLTP